MRKPGSSDKLNLPANAADIREQIGGQKPKGVNQLIASDALLDVTHSQRSFI
jgi:hypothetical protein